MAMFNSYVKLPEGTVIMRDPSLGLEIVVSFRHCVRKKFLSCGSRMHAKALPPLRSKSQSQVISYNL